ncbi:MAG: hypothetical protein CMM25_00570 [Rhodospirillaceae bacterium]|mgnify:CR=1 FL=1|nr:hypothetical protein [Rhodospirillaceae bacterium]|tara:strand:- start:49 stop:516 length:468 start_codon:yes stop_codon:yes gene_type:complete
MDAKTKVAADKAGNVIVRSSNNPEYGHIRVEQTRMVIDDSGFARRKKLSALIPGLVEDLKGFAWSADEQVEGKIIVKESLNPFNSSDPERDYKIAGNSGIVCCQDGQPIYRKNFFTLSSSAEDVSVEHTNGDEIKAAYAELKENAALKPNEDFSL